MTRFFSIKPNSNSHIFSSTQGRLVGKFVNGVFDTEERLVVEELTKRYKSQIISDIIDVVFEEVVETEVPETEPTEIEKEIEATKAVIEEVKEAVESEFTEKELKEKKMPELLNIYKNAGYTYKVGLKKVELIKQLLL